MTGRRIKVSAARFGDAIEKWGENALPMLRAAAYDSCLRGVGQAVELTNKAGVVDRGSYKLAWRAARTREGGHLINDAPYAGIIENGRRPGAPGPPLAPILAWVRRKGLKPLTKTGRKSRRKKATDAELEGIAWAIRNSIHVNGTKPRLIGKKAAKKIGKNFQELLERALDKAAG